MNHSPLPPAPRAVSPLPDWAFELPEPAPGRGDAVPVPVSPARGWRLPGGAVVCRACRQKPADAVPVTLVGEDGDPRWEESAIETAAGSPGDCGTRTDGGADVDVDDAESGDDDGPFPEDF